MKKKIWALLFFFPLCGYALYNGNPSFPEMPEEGINISKESWAAFKIGYEGDWAFDRRLKEERVPHGQHRHIDRFSSSMNSGVFTLCFHDQVELYGNLGVMAANFYHRPLPTMRINYQTYDQFLWGAGGRAILIHWGDVVMGVEGRYAQAFPEVKWATLNGANLVGEHFQLIYREWQAGVSFARQVGIFYPYIGLKYSAVSGKVLHLKSLEALFPDEQFSLSSRGKVGLFLGFGLSPGRTINLNLEVRFVDEEAGTLSGDIRF